MTTTVRILIEGNKQCRVKVDGGDVKQAEGVLVLPGGFATAMIHGAQEVRVEEEGDFLPAGKLIWMRTEG